MTGRKRHYIPASYISQFSSDKEAPALRERKVWVLRRGKSDIIQQKAENVAYVKNLYGYGSEHDIDSYFTTAELHLMPAIERLGEANDDWLHAESWFNLSWFISNLFARVPDFQEELYERFQIITNGQADRLKGYLTTDNANIARIMENQLISGAVLRARWAFFKSPDWPLIVNDRGTTGMLNPIWQSYGYIIPLGLDFGVMLGTGPYPKLLKRIDGTWHINIPTYIIIKEHGQNINESMWLFSRREVYGSQKAELERIRDKYGYNPPPPSDAIMQGFRGAKFLGLDGRERMENEMLFLKVLTLVNKPEDPEEPPGFTI